MMIPASKSINRGKSSKRIAQAWIPVLQGSFPLMENPT